MDRTRKNQGGVSDRAEQKQASKPGKDVLTPLVRSSPSGSPLPAGLRRKFEASLGADLSRVRVHRGGESAAAAKSVRARAFTVGQDIHFNDGQYDPSNARGERLLAHEVAHTVQQRGAQPVAQYKLEVSRAGDAHEREADHAADCMVDGAPATVGEHGLIVARVGDEGSADVSSTVGGDQQAGAGGAAGGLDLPAPPALHADPAHCHDMATELKQKMDDQVKYEIPNQNMAAHQNQMIAHCIETMNLQKGYYLLDALQIPSANNAYSAFAGAALPARAAVVDYVHLKQSLGIKDGQSIQLNDAEKAKAQRQLRAADLDNSVATLTAATAAVNDGQKDIQDHTQGVIQWLSGDFVQQMKQEEDKDEKQKAAIEQSIQNVGAAVGGIQSALSTILTLGSGVNDLFTGDDEEAAKAVKSGAKGAYGLLGKLATFIAASQKQGDIDQINRAIANAETLVNIGQSQQAQAGWAAVSGGLKTAAGKYQTLLSQAVIAAGKVQNALHELMPDGAADAGKDQTKQAELQHTSIAAAQGLISGAIGSGQTAYQTIVAVRNGIQDHRNTGWQEQRLYGGNASTPVSGEAAKRSDQDGADMDALNQMVVAVMLWQNAAQQAQQALTAEDPLK